MPAPRPAVAVKVDFHNRGAADPAPPLRGPPVVLSPSDLYLGGAILPPLRPAGMGKRAAGASGDCRKGMIGVLLDVAAADASQAFRWPLQTSALPRYDELVRNPLDLSTIAAKVFCDLYGSKDRGDRSEGQAEGEGGGPPREQEMALLRFEDDLVDMLYNCCVYNGSSSPYFATAVALLGQLPGIFTRHFPDPRGGSSSGGGGGAMVRRFLHCAQSGGPLPASKAATGAAAPAPLALAQQVVMLQVLAFVERQDESGRLSAPPIALTDQASRSAGRGAVLAPPLPLSHIWNGVLGLRYSSVAEFQREVEHALVAVASDSAHAGRPAATAAIATRAALPREIVQAFEELQKMLVDGGAEDGGTHILLPPGGPGSAASLIQERRPLPLAAAAAAAAAVGEGKAVSIRHQLLQVLDALVQLDVEGWFSWPVLSREYHECVREPIDFFTMRVKLRCGLYDCNRNTSRSGGAAASATASCTEVVRAFTTDVERIVDNCVSFLGPDARESKKIYSIRSRLPEVLREFELA